MIGPNHPGVAGELLSECHEVDIAAAWSTVLESALGTAVRLLPAREAGAGCCDRAPAGSRCSACMRRSCDGAASVQVVEINCPFGVSSLVRKLAAAGDGPLALKVGPFRASESRDREGLRPAWCDEVSSRARVAAAPEFPAGGSAGVGALLDSVARSIERETRSGGALPAAVPPAVGKALRHISEHLLEPVSVARLATHVGLSPDHFARVFKQATGLGVKDYVTRERLNLARRMLCGSYLRISEVSFASGYESVPHFNRSFRRCFGTSPRAFREAWRQSADARCPDVSEPSAGGDGIVSGAGVQRAAAATLGPADTRALTMTRA